MIRVDICRGQWDLFTVQTICKWPWGLV